MNVRKNIVQKSHRITLHNISQGQYNQNPIHALDLSRYQKKWLGFGFNSSNIS